MAPDPELPPVGGGVLPVEEEQIPEEGHVVARRRPDGPKIDDVGDPVPLERHPHA